MSTDELISKLVTPALKERQRRMISLSFDLMDVLDEYNVKHWLGFGTLLGCLRDGGVIPWDDDVDICLFREDRERVLGLDIKDCEWKKANETLYRLVRLNEDGSRYSHIDVFFLTPDHERQERHLRRDEILPLRYMEWEDRMCPVPRYPWAWLNRRGDGDVSVCRVFNHSINPNDKPGVEHDPEMYNIRYEDLPDEYKRTGFPLK